MKDGEHEDAEPPRRPKPARDGRRPNRPGRGIRRVWWPVPPDHKHEKPGTSRLHTTTVMSDGRATDHARSGGPISRNADETGHVADSAAMPPTASAPVDQSAPEQSANMPASWAVAVAGHRHQIEQRRSRRSSHTTEQHGRRWQKDNSAAIEARHNDTTYASPSRMARAKATRAKAIGCDMSAAPLVRRVRGRAVADRRSRRWRQMTTGIQAPRSPGDPQPPEGRRR